MRLALVVLLLTPLAAAQAPDPCAQAPQTCATLIATHATSRTRIPNTAVDVVVGITATGKDLATVQRTLAASSASLIKYLHDQKAERLITARVSFAPDTRYEKSGPEKTVGYTGSATVSFRTTPEKVADLLGGVLSNGADKIQSTTFTPSEEEIAAARRALAADATKTAIAQAETIASAAGLHIVSVRNIAVDEGSTSMPFQSNSQVYTDGYTGGLFMMHKAAAPSPVATASGDDELSIRVDALVAAAH